MPVEEAWGIIPEEALAFWRDRQPITDSRLKKLDEAARKRAFTVAGLARDDMLADLHASLEEAIRNGETLAQWKKRIPEILEATGWRGHRIETIYQTNVQTAYMAGRYVQMRESVKTRPYWMYVAVGDHRTRPHHRVLNGLVFSADDLFWATNYPPNGFRCRCTVITLSARQVERMGVTIQEGPPQNLLYVDPVTGMESFIHIIAPDKGFAGNPAKDWLEGRFAPAA